MMIILRLILIVALFSQNSAAFSTPQEARMAAVGSINWHRTYKAYYSPHPKILADADITSPIFAAYSHDTRREILEKTLSGPFPHLHSLKSNDDSLELTVSQWGFVLRGRSSPDCRKILPQLATRIKFQFLALRTNYLALSRNRDEIVKDAMAAVAFAESRMAIIAQSLCDMLLTDEVSFFGGFWATAAQELFPLATESSELFSLKNSILEPGVSDDLFQLGICKSMAVTTRSLYAGFDEKYDRIFDGSSLETRRQDILERTDAVIAASPQIFGTSKVIDVIIERESSHLLHFYVAWSDEAVFIAFPGSLKIQDWLKNIRFHQCSEISESGCPYSVHNGFLEGYSTTRKYIKRALEKALHTTSGRPFKSFYVAGHSLGGTIASKLSFDFVESIIRELLNDEANRPTGRNSLASLAHFKEIYRGCAIGSAPVGDENYGRLFNEANLKFISFYSNSDIVANALTMLESCKKIDWLKKLIPCSWKHPGTIMVAEELGFPTTGAPTDLTFYLRADFLEDMAASHLVRRYGGIINQITLLDSSSNRKRMQSGFGFLLYSHALKAYCGARNLDSNQWLTCTLSRAEALNAQMIAFSASYQGKMFPLWTDYSIKFTDNHELRYAAPIAVLSGEESDTYAWKNDMKCSGFSFRHAVYSKLLKCDGESVGVDSRRVWKFRQWDGLNREDDTIMLDFDETIGAFVKDVFVESVEHDKHLCAGSDVVCTTDTLQSGEERWITDNRLEDQPFKFRLELL